MPRAINKVVYGSTVLIDITDTTASASDVASGKYFYTADGVKTLGTGTSGGGMSVIETPDSHGGTIVSITGDSVRLQTKTNITPTKSSQTIIPDANYNGLASVQIDAIPAAYQDVTGVTASAGDVVSGKDIVDSSGSIVHGSLVIQHYYTGSTVPTSSLGEDGDIYLEVVS